MKPVKNTTNRDAEVSPLQSYSAMIELVGVRDLAAEEPSEYKLAMTQLFNAVRNALDDADGQSPHTKITVCGFLDKCLATSEDLQVLLGFVISIRDELMATTAQCIFLRGVVMNTSVEEGEENSDPNENSNTTNKARMNKPQVEEPENLFRAFNVHPEPPHNEWRAEKTLAITSKSKGCDCLENWSASKVLGFPLIANLRTAWIRKVQLKPLRTSMSLIPNKGAIEDLWILS